MKKLLPGFVVLLLGSGGLSAAAADSVALKYAEGGNWYAHLLVFDDDGWPDTLEKRAYATEAQARERVEWMRRTLGAREAGPEPTRGPTPELRDPGNGEIWTATAAWSEAWEDRFAEWVRERFDAEFFARHGIATDCADAVIAQRWIFARIHGLPAGNRLTGGRALVTNRSVRASWRDLPTAANWFEDRRFLAALDYVLHATYTHSLLADSYPIKIDGRRVREGVFHLEIRARDGHTRIVSRVHRDGSRWPIDVLSSSVPREVRNLFGEPFTVYAQPSASRGGLVGHRWVRLAPTEASLVAAEAMPGHSLEQFQPGFFRGASRDFSEEVAARLVDAFDPLLGMAAVFDGLERAIALRRDVVADGFAVCAREDCAPGTENYEYWSTPSRDRRIGDAFTQIRGYLGSLAGDPLRRARALYRERASRPLLEFEGRVYRYAELEATWRATRFSSDPRDPPRRRWGAE